MLPPNDDIVLSTTCFIDIPVTFAVMYGCNDTVIKDTAKWLRKCGKAAFHPLILPMIFAELKRKRFVNAKDALDNQLNSRITALRKRANRKTSTKSSRTQTLRSALVGKATRFRDRNTGRRDTDPQPSNDTTTKADCDAIDIARSMRTLMNGLESFQEQLILMKDHLQTSETSQSNLGPGLGAGQEVMRESKVYIEGRLQDMCFEFGTKIRSCDVLVGTMTLVTQMVCAHTASNCWTWRA